jgi:dephospho-CoA kinase
MKISFTGTHSTGKTTLLNILKNSPEYSQFTFHDEITRKVQAQGIDINENGNNLTQLLILDTHIRNLLSPRFIADRCILDGIVYTEWLYNNYKIDDWVYSYSRNLFKYLIPQYDILFYLVPEFNIVDDGVRSTSHTFQHDIQTIFEKYIEQYNIPVVYITGTVENRIEQVNKHIYEQSTTSKQSSK